MKDKRTGPRWWARLPDDEELHRLARGERTEAEVEREQARREWLENAFTTLPPRGRLAPTSPTKQENR